MNIRAIIWDLEGVLLQNHGHNLPALVADRLGAPLDATNEIFFSETNDRVDLGEMSQDDFWYYLLDQLGKPRKMKYILDHIFDEELFIDQDLLETIRRYRKTYKVGLITNFSDDLRERLAGPWSVEGAFDAIVISCEVGMVKPDPRIFQLALKKLGVRPHEAVFIDDRPHNVEGARKVGLHAISFENKQQALNELDTLLAAAS